MRPLFYLAPAPWTGPRQRPHHLAAGLARTRPVVYVEPPTHSFGGALRRHLAGRPGSPLGGQMRRVGERLFVFSPLPSLPFGLHGRAINRFVHRLAWLQLRGRAGALLTGGGVDVVVGWPPALELARALRPRRLIYDCMDLFPAFHAGRARALMVRLEAELAHRATAVVVSSRDLERRWSGRHGRVVRIPNGVDVARFAPAERPVPPDLAGLPAPRLGFVGTIGPWIDLGLLAALARRRPDCSVVLIGPLEQQLRAEHPPNLHLLGERPYEDVPAYLGGFDALLIPFRASELARAVNPIKLYEYCATGKPIVSTPLEEVLAAGEACYVGDGAEGFAAAVECAFGEIAGGDPSRRAARLALARDSDWDAHVAAFDALLDQSRDGTGARGRG